MLTLILCEEDNDILFLQRFFKQSLATKVVPGEEKDKEIRRVFNQISLQKILIVNEGDKSKLIKKLNILVSTLRSIKGIVAIHAIIDSDSSTTQHLLDRIKGNRERYK